MGDCIRLIVWEAYVDLQLIGNMLLTGAGGYGVAKGGAVVPFVSDT